MYSRQSRAFAGNTGAYDSRHCTVTGPTASCDSESTELQNHVRSVPTYYAAVRLTFDFSNGKLVHLLPLSCRGTLCSVQICDLY